VRDLSVNLRRLVFFHHATAREAAKALGVSEHAVGAWLAGKREPATGNLFRLADLYDVDPSKLAGDPYVFAQVLANPDRMRRAEENLAKWRRDRLKAV
jgi:transcriptional regulator with XRE-family HTH domain